MAGHVAETGQQHLLGIFQATVQMAEQIALAAPDLGRIHQQAGIVPGLEQEVQCPRRLARRVLLGGRLQTQGHPEVAIPGHVQIAQPGSIAAQESARLSRGKFHGGIVLAKGVQPGRAVGLGGLGHPAAPVPAAHQVIGQSRQERVEQSVGLGFALGRGPAQGRHGLAQTGQPGSVAWTVQHRQPAGVEALAICAGHQGRV